MSNHPNGHRESGWAAPILTLDDIELERPCVSINGTLYGYLNPMDMSLMDQSRFRRIQRKAAKLEEANAKAQAAMGDDYEPEEEYLLASHECFGELVQLIIPDLPQDVLDGLSSAKRSLIIQRFGEARGVGKTPPLAPLRSPRGAERKRAGVSPAMHGAETVVETTGEIVPTRPLIGESTSPGYVPRSRPTRGGTG